jgi:membrane protein required for colicin V production
MNMAGIDVVFMVIIAISALRCAARGFISELLSMAALIFGLLAALLFFKQGAVLVRGWFMPDVKVVPEIISFISFFLIVYVTVKIIEMTLKSIIEGIQLGGLDHFLGFMLGVVEGVIIVCLLLFLISIQPFFNPDSLLEDSILAKVLLPLIIGDKEKVMEAIARLEMRKYPPVGEGTGV